MKHIHFILFAAILLNTACSSSKESTVSDCIIDAEELTIPENINFVSNSEMLERISESDGAIDYQFPMVVGGMSALMGNLQFPNTARGRVGTERVVLQALIGENGEVLDLVLLESADCYLMQAAIHAVNASEFTPATLGNEAIATTMNIPIVFRQ